MIILIHLGCMNRKVLVTDHVHERLITGLQDLGYEVSYEPAFDPAELKARLSQYYGIIINSKIRMTKDVMKHADRLAFIGRLGSGLEIIDLDYAGQKGIAVFNSPEGNRNAVAEHALGMLLALTNNILLSDREVRQGIWKREANRGIELSGRTIGIVGLGNTGQAFAKKLSGWALDLIYTDPYVLNAPPDLNYISKVTLRELCEKSDVISFHVPLTPETHHMVNASFIKACRKRPILINTSRGAVADTRALVSGLQSGLISGACLDVFENEKPHSFTGEEKDLYEALYNMPNVVLTPHIAGWTRESLNKIAEVLLTRISSL